MNPFTRLTQVNWIAILAATVAGFFLGFMWYGLVFQSAWMSLTGFTEADFENVNMGLQFGVSIPVTFIAAWGLAVLIGKSGSMMDGLMTGVFASLFFVATMLAQNYVYSLKPLGLWLVDAGFIVAMFAIMGAVIGIMKKPV